MSEELKEKDALSYPVLARLSITYLLDRFPEMTPETLAELRPIVRLQGAPGAPEWKLYAMAGDGAEVTLLIDAKTGLLLGASVEQGNG